MRRNEERRATLLILDGARPDVLEVLSAAGDLPYISRYVLEPGGMVPATTVFPSTTGVAYLPFLTGCYPGSCDVPGIRWMDVSRYRGRWVKDREQVRSYCGYQAGKLNTDLKPGVQSLFDLERDTAALCTPFTRGLLPGAERVRTQRAILGSQAHYTSWYEALDRAVGRELERVAPLRKRLVFAVFPAVDGVTHWTDPWHARVLNVYRDFDRAFGRYVRRGGLAGNHLLVIASDHGASTVGLHEDVSLALERFGLPTLRHPLLWRRNPEVAVMVSGNAAAHVYLKPGVRRSRRWSLPAIEAGDVPGIPRDLADRIANLAGVALVAATDGSDVVIVSKEGRARIVPGSSENISYRPESADVLGLGGESVEATAAEWVGLSYDTAFPDATVQLLQLFRSRRAGDLVVAAAPGADLRSDWEIPEHRSGHGSLTAEHMRCVVATNRPVSGPMRTVDLFPLMVEHLGHEIPPGIDGQLLQRSLAPALSAK